MPAQGDERYSFEEFQLVYESAEKVTERRLSLNRFNYSVCVALLLATVYMVNWSRTNLQYSYLGLFFAFALSVLAVLFCIYWLAIISDYKRLNNAKFAVLAEMAPRVWFGPNAPPNLVSAEPFKREWRIVKTIELDFRKDKLQVLSSSSAELFVPKAFMACFVFLGIFAALPILFHLHEFWDGVTAVIHMWSPVPAQ